MVISAKSITKFFLYLAPLAVLIVASDMFFPFIVGKAIFFRTVIACATLAYAAHILFWSSAEERADAWGTVKNPIFLSIASFTLLFLAASLLAVNPQMAFWSNFERGEGGLQMIFYGLFFSLLALIIKTKKEWTSYIAYLLPIGALVSLYAIGQRMNFLYIRNLKEIAAAGGNIDQKLLQANPWSGFFGDGSRISGTLGNPLYISTFILFILFFLTLLYLERVKNRTGQIALMIVAVLEIIVFSMAESRNGLAGAIGGIIAFLIVMLVQGKNIQLLGISFRRAALLILAAGVIIGGLFYTTRTSAVCAAYGGENSVCLRLADAWAKVPILNRFAKDRVLSGLDDRLWTWGSALSGIIERPILGWGPENFPLVFDRYYNANHYGGDSWFDRAHDVYLDYLIDGGIVLLIAYLAIWYFYFRGIYRQRSRLSLPLLGLLVGFPVAYLITGISAFEVLPIFLMLYIFFAMNLRLFASDDVTAARTERRPTAPPSSFNIMSLGVMSTLVILAVATLYYANYRPYYKNRQLLEVASAGDSANTQAVYEKYLKTLDYSSPIGQQETVQYYLLFIYRYLEINAKNQDLAKMKDQLLGLVAQANQIYELNENSPYRAVGVKTLSYLGLIHLRTAEILRDQRMLEDAQKLFEKGLAIAPTRLEYIYPLIDIAITRGDKAKAKSLLGLANNLRPDLPRHKQYENLLNSTSTLMGTSTQ